MHLCLPHEDKKRDVAHCSQINSNFSQLKLILPRSTVQNFFSHRCSTPHPPQRRHLHITRIQKRSAKYFAKFHPRESVLVDNHNERLKGITQLASSLYTLRSCYSESMFCLVYYLFIFVVYVCVCLE